jgi:hypothetical protein
MRTPVSAKGLALAVVVVTTFATAALYASHRITTAQIERGDCGITPEDARQEAMNFAVVHSVELGLPTYPKDRDLTFVERQGTCMYTFEVVSGAHRADVVVYDNYPHTAVAVTGSSDAAKP